jgi:hypothetical protein
MSAILQNLPGTGRGTIRRMVEGYVRNCATSIGQEMRGVPLHPRAARGGPPPRAGEVL